MKHPIKHYVLKYKYFIAIAVFALVIGFIGDHSLINRISQQREIETLNQGIASQKKEYIKDKQELQRIKHNPEAVKQVAHEKYYMKTEDEDIFVIDDND